MKPNGGTRGSKELVGGVVESSKRTKNIHNTFDKACSYAYEQNISDAGPNRGGGFEGQVSRSLTGRNLSHNFSIQRQDLECHGNHSRKIDMVGNNQGSPNEYTSKRFRENAS